MYIYAHINKNTLRFVREQKAISFDYVTRITKFKEDIYPENVQLPRWTEGSVSIWQRKANGIQAILSSKEAPKRNIKEAQHRVIWRDAGLFLITAIFSRWSNALLADSSFAFCCVAWECTVSKNFTRRSIPRTLYRALLFFAQEERNLLFSLRPILARRFYCLIVNSLSN